MEKTDIRQLQVRVDRKLKEDFAAFCKGAGLTVSGAIHLLMSESIRQNKLPFQVQLIDYNLSGSSDSTIMGIKVAEENKKAFSTVCDSLGLTMAAVIKMYMARCIADGKLPF